MRTTFWPNFLYFTWGCIIRRNGITITSVLSLDGINLSTSELAKVDDPLIYYYLWVMGVVRCAKNLLFICRPTKSYLQKNEMEMRTAHRDRMQNVLTTVDTISIQPRILYLHILRRPPCQFPHSQSPINAIPVRCIVDNKCEYKFASVEQVANFKWSFFIVRGSRRRRKSKFFPNWTAECRRCLRMRQLFYGKQNKASIVNLIVGLFWHSPFRASMRMPHQLIIISLDA